MDLTGIYTVDSPTGVASLFGGNAVNLFLYGALTVQLYLYYMSFPEDPWPLKTAVYVIYATETAYTFILTYNIGNIMFGGVSPPADLYTIYFIVIPVGGGIVAFLTQATYVYRVRVLSQLKYVSWCIMALIAADFVVIIILAPIMSRFVLYYMGHPNVPNSYPNYAVGFEVWASVSLAIDTTIAGIMIWSLKKKEILSKRLMSKIAHLVYLIIGTGVLTATINLVTVILFAVGSPTVLGPAIVLSKIYANSMMVFLNDRIPYGHRSDQMMVTGPLNSIHFVSAPKPADAVQKQLSLESRDNASSASGRTAVGDPYKQHSCPV